jgi:hypothetical protein
MERAGDAMAPLLDKRRIERQQAELALAGALAEHESSSTFPRLPATKRQLVSISSFTWSGSAITSNDKRWRRIVSM